MRLAKAPPARVERIGGELDEATYWTLLMFRLCGEFAGIEDCKRLGLWCDGLVPDAYDLAETPACIRGVAWIGYDLGRGSQEEWRFTLVLDGAPKSPQAIEWSTQLPPDDVTRWMVLDFDQRVVEIEPAAAVSDASVLEKPLADLEASLRLAEEVRFARLVANAIASGGGPLQAFLQSDELWGGTGSIAERAGSGRGRGEDRRSIEAALLELGETQLGLGAVNERTEDVGRGVSFLAAAGRLTPFAQGPFLARLRCSCGLMPRTRLKAVLRAKGVL